MESSSIAKPKEFFDREDDFGEIVDRAKKNVSLTRKLKIAARDKKIVSVPRVGGVRCRWLRCAKVAPRLSADSDLSRFVVKKYHAKIIGRFDRGRRFIFMSLFCYNCEDGMAVELHFQSKQCK